MYVAVRDCLVGHPALSAAQTLLVEVGGGSRGHHAAGRRAAEGLGRLRAWVGPACARPLRPWAGDVERRARLLARNIDNVVRDILRDVPVRSAGHMIALGGEHAVRCPSAGRRAGGRRGRGAAGGVRRLLRRGREARRGGSRGAVRAVVGRRRDARARAARVPGAAPRDIGRRHHRPARVAAGRTAGRHGRAARSDAARRLADFSQQVLASAEALGEKYRHDVVHARNVAFLATRLFDELRREHGLDARDRLLLEVAAIAARHRRVRRPSRASQARAVPDPGLRDLRAVGRRPRRSSRTWPGTTGAACRSSRTSRTWPSTAPSASG